MGRHIVLGKGAVGASTASELARRGHEVVVLSRSGGEQGVGGIRHVAVDAGDPIALRDATRGAAVLYNCLNPSRYDLWAQQWPPMAVALLDAAEANGASLVTMSNLYPYGPVDAPMTEQTPLASMDEKGRIRADMWQQALARHEAGRVRATEARAGTSSAPGCSRPDTSEAELCRACWPGSPYGSWVISTPRTPGRTSPMWLAPWRRSAPTTIPGVGRGTCPAHPRERTRDGRRQSRMLQECRRFAWAVCHGRWSARSASRCRCFVRCIGSATSSTGRSRWTAPRPRTPSGFATPRCRRR